MKRPLALVTIAAALVAQGGYRFPAHNFGYHIGATIVIPPAPILSARAPREIRMSAQPVRVTMRPSRNMWIAIGASALILVVVIIIALLTT